MSLLLGVGAILALSWAVGATLTTVIQTIHWDITPWFYKRLTGSDMGRRRPRD